MLDNDKLSIWQ